MLVAGALSASAAAQVGGHPTIAPLAPGAVFPTDPKKTSPYWNKPNGVWDKGEAFLNPDMPDVGGALGPDLHPENVKLSSNPPYLQPFFGGNGWQVYDTTEATGLYHWVGEMRGKPQGNPIEPFVGSVEIVSPLPSPSQPPARKNHAIVVLCIPPTHGSAAVGQQPYAYPGEPGNYGLWTKVNPSGQWYQYPWPYADRIVERYRDTPPPGADYDVFAAYVVEPTSVWPLLWSVQRFRQLRYAVEKRLVADFGYSTANIAYLVAGASYGGLPAHVAPLLYPDEFHGGIDSAFNANLRGLGNDQDSFDFATALLGSPRSGANTYEFDFHDWTIFCQTEGTDFTSLSLINRLALNRQAGGGHVLRPFYLLCGDVDLVTHGNDWAYLIDPTLTPPNKPWAGRWNTLGSGSVPVYWSVVGKNCHSEEGVGEPYYIHPDTSQTPTNGKHTSLDVVWKMIETTPIPPQAISPSARPPRLVAKSSLLATLDPHDHILDRDDDRSPPNDNDYLKLPPTEGPNRFVRYGQGTWLGWHESLVVKNGVFVGSAEGVITKFGLTTAGSVEALTDVAGSHQLINNVMQPYALGYGVWALAVGDVDSANSGDEVVAAAYRRIGVFDANTLKLLRVADAPFGGSDEAFNYNWPRRIQIADLLSTNPGNEIVCTSVNGRITVLSGQLAGLARFGEAGVQDIVVGPAPALRVQNTPFTKPVFLLSRRGHVASIELDGAAPPQPFLSALSELQYGDMWDLEAITWNGQPRLLAFFSNAFDPSLTPLPGTQTTSFRLFDPSTLALVDQFGDVTNPGGGMPVLGKYSANRGREPSVAIAQGSGGTTHLVALYNNYLLVWDSTKAFKGGKDLSTFRPCLEAMAVAAGDFDATTPGDEVVVSTQAGKVVWFRLSELMTSGTSLNLTRNAVTLGGIAYDHRTNSTLAATWALAIKPGTPKELHAIDRTGTWWKIDPATGTPTFVREFIPVNQIVYAGDGISGLQNQSVGGGPAAETLWQVAKPGSLGFDIEIQSQPYLPNPTLARPDQWDYPLAPVSLGFIHDGFWIFGASGGVSPTLPSGQIHAAWWANNPSYANHVQALRYTLAGPALQAIWNSTGASNFDSAKGYNVRPPAPTLPDDGIALRTEIVGPDHYIQSACKVGYVYPAYGHGGSNPPGVPQAVVSGVDGKVLVLDSRPGTTTTDAILTQSQDFGFGGQALALANLDSDPYDEVLFAPLWCSVDSAGNPARAKLYVLDHNGSAFTTLASADLAHPSNPDFPGYGACGIAVAQLDASPGPEIIVTTLNGEIVVFTWNQSAMTLTPLHRRIVDGAVGAYGSILVDDLLNGDGKPEVYIASSSGVRRFDL